MTDIFDEFRRMEENMNRIFEELWGTPIRGRPLLLPGETSIQRYGREGRERRPFIDVSETEKEVVAVADMPGVSKEDIKINLTGDRLEISAESKSEEEKKGEGYVYRERRRGGFYRSVSLPSEIDPDNAKASYNNGVLEIKMPKIESKKKTSIKVE